MAILNYTTKIQASQTVGEIMAMLSKFGVRNISLDYGDKGEPTGVQFTFLLPDGKPLLFRLEENTPGVHKALQKSAAVKPAQKTLEHARNVAWRIKKDFLEAQLALIEAGIASLPELFIGDLIVNDSGQRLIEKFATNDNQLLLD